MLVKVEETSLSYLRYLTDSLSGSQWGDFDPQGTLAMSGEGFGLSQLGGRAALASFRQRPGMLLTFYKALTSPPQPRIIWPQMAGVLKLRNPGLERRND